MIEPKSAITSGFASHNVARDLCIAFEPTLRGISIYDQVFPFHKPDLVQPVKSTIQGRLAKVLSACELAANCQMTNLILFGGPQRGRRCVSQQSC